MNKMRALVIIGSVVVVGCAVRTGEHVGQTSSHVEGDMDAAAGPAALPPCNITQTTMGPVAQSPSQAVGTINQAMSGWVAGLCGEGFKATPRDVTCAFKTKVDEPTPGMVSWSPWDWPSSAYGGTYKRWLKSTTEYFDAAGSSVGKTQGGAWPKPADDNLLKQYACSVACTGKVLATLATAEITGASAVGVPPGFIPPQNDAPQGKSFCAEYQRQLLANNADCSTGNAKSEWSVSLTGSTGLATPWKLTGETGSDTSQYDSVTPAEQKLFPTAVRSVVNFDYEIWVIEAQKMLAACAALFETKAPTDADKKKLCDDGVAKVAFSSVVPAAICITDAPAKCDTSSNCETVSSDSGVSDETADSGGVADMDSSAP